MMKRKNRLVKLTDNFLTCTALSKRKNKVYYTFLDAVAHMWQAGSTLA